jgi:hypothetical protein
VSEDDPGNGKPSTISHAKETSMQETSGSHHKWIERDSREINLAIDAE